MTRQGWAKKVIARTFQAHKGPLTGYAVKALLAEHKRAVRVVKALKKAIQSPICDVDEGYIMACDDILAALQKGRT